MIELVHLRKEYDSAIPLKDVNTVIHDGDIISVIGPSGTGKSTLLRCINMLDTPTSGRVIVDGEDVTAPGCDLGRLRQKMGMVFQSFNLFPNLTAIENIMMPQTDLLGRSRQEAYDKGMELLRTVGLSEKALKYPDGMSGGQKQRVAIARTLAMDPDTILLDEPTSALDPSMVGEVEAVIRQLAAMGKTMLIVTHEMRFAKAICNRVFYMDEGGIYEDGPPEQIFDNPQREKTRRFIRKVKVLELEVRGKDYDYLGTQSLIEEYCIKNQISRKLTRHLHLAFEEMVQQTLLPALEQPDISVTAEYTEEPECAVMRICYAGEPFDPAGANQLSMAVLSTAAQDIRYTWHPEKEQGNEVTMSIKP